MDDACFTALLGGVESDGGLLARRRRLPPAVAALHQRILHHFAASGAAPTSEKLRRWAAELGVDAGNALRVLVGVDLIQGDPHTLRVLGAYPFTSAPRGHRVDVAGGSTIEAYCAADALGVSAMLDRAVTITSHDPQTGAEVRVEVRDGETTSDPPDAVVSVPMTAEEARGQAGDDACPTVNFYTSIESARVYQRAHGVSLGIMTLPQALQFASAIFRGHIEPEESVSGEPNARAVET